MSRQRAMRGSVVFSMLSLLVLASFFTTGIATRPPQRRLEEAAESYCEGTFYPSLCKSTVVGIPNLLCTSISGVISALVGYTEGQVRHLASVCADQIPRFDQRQRMAVTDCLDLFDQTLDELNIVVQDLSGLNTRGCFHDIQTDLSAAITNQYTCLDGLAYASNSSVQDSIADGLYHTSHVLSNALAMTKRLPQKPRYPKNEPFDGFGRVGRSGFPSWLAKRDKRLLQAPVSNMTVDLVVAKDGTGNFTTIGEAVAAAPNKSDTRFVIYIKAGGYFENVEIIRKKRNLMFVGDGMWKTIVKASRNVVDGWTTFRSATVAVKGKGFLARDMTFENSAGPSKHQAVAFRSSADLSAFYRCSFAAYQDTLYVHSLRQFYSECDVYGTVDFIFGNAAAVLQRCNLYARKPNPKQKNIFTAQGRQDPNQNTGISIQNCKVAPAADLIPVQSSFKTYLGRPWKEYSRTVFMNSYLGDLIEPAGWLEWSGDFALSTLYYGEYMNRGPGSNTSMRVDWPGYRVITNTTEAAQFTPGAFIDGDQWLPATGFPYASGLI